MFGQKFLNAAVSLAAMAAEARGWQKISIILGVRRGATGRGQDALAISRPLARPPAFITSSERRGLCALEGLKVLRYQPTHMPCLSRERAAKTRALQNRKTKATELDLLFTAAGRIFI